MSAGELTRRAVGGLLWTGGGKAAYGVLYVVVLAILARMLSPAEFGVVSAALVVIGVSQIVSQLGLGPALVQRPALEPRHVDTAFAASIGIGVVLGSLVWTAGPAAAAFLRVPDAGPVIQALAWVFPLQGVAVVAESLLRRDLEFRRLAQVEVASYALGYGLVGIVLAAAGWGVWALVAGQIAQSVVRTVWVVALRPPRPTQLGDRRSLAELLYFGGGFTLARIANYIAVQGDNLVVARTLGPAALGVYGRAYGLMSAPAYGFGTVLDTVLFPAMARIQDDPARLAAAYRRGVALLALIVLPPSVVLIVVAPEFIRVVLGPRWDAAVVPFQVLAIGMLFRTSYKISDSLARATGAVYRRAWRQVFYAGLVVLAAWVGQFWGVAGVAWGALAALAVNFGLMAQLSLRLARFPWSEFWAAHVPAVRLTLLAAPPAWVAAAGLRAVGAPAAIVLAAAAAAAAAVAVAALTRAPGAFLGPDGAWIATTLRDYATRFRRRDAATAPVGA